MSVFTVASAWPTSTRSNRLSPIPALGTNVSAPSESSAAPMSITTGSPAASADASSTRHHTRKKAHALRSSEGIKLTALWLFASHHSIWATDSRCFATRMSAPQPFTTGTTSRSAACCADSPCWLTAKMSIQQKSSGLSACAAAATTSANSPPQQCDMNAFAGPTAPSSRTLLRSA